MKEYVNTIKLGAKLEELRIKKGFSQEYAAKKLGITQSKLHRIEKAKNAYIDEETMHDLAFLYNVTIEEIYSQPEETNEPEATQEPEQSSSTRETGKTSELLALLSMLLGRPESEVIDLAVIQYAEEINFKSLIRKRFMQEE